MLLGPCVKLVSRYVMYTQSVRLSLMALIIAWILTTWCITKTRCSNQRRKFYWNTSVPYGHQVTQKVADITQSDRHFTQSVLLEEITSYKTYWIIPRLRLLEGSPRRLKTFLYNVVKPRKQLLHGNASREEGGCNIFTAYRNSMCCSIQWYLLEIPVMFYLVSCSSTFDVPLRKTQGNPD